MKICREDAQAAKFNGTTFGPGFASCGLDPCEFVCD
jgi:hypothetical protein